LHLITNIFNQSVSRSGRLFDGASAERLIAEVERHTCFQLSLSGQNRQNRQKSSL